MPKLWIIMECQNRQCNSRHSPVRERPRCRGGRWPVSGHEAKTPDDRNHLCPSCGEPGLAIKRLRKEPIRDYVAS